VPQPTTASGSVVQQAEAIASSAACDNSTHPSGQGADDPPCGYSDCETGDAATYSAVCACIDPVRYGLRSSADNNGTGGGGYQWHCLYSTCRCSDSTAPVVAAGNNTADPSSKSAASATAGWTAFFLPLTGLWSLWWLSMTL
jgi:hypothetical protein